MRLLIEKKMLSTPYRPLCLFCFFVFCFVLLESELNARGERQQYIIVIDPGHGSAPSKRRDDRWDPISRRYISFSNYGSQYKDYHEHRIVMALAKKLQYFLNLSQTDWGWQRFTKYLAQFSKNQEQNFPRVMFLSYLTRKEGWEERGRPLTDPEVNAPYRMYDYPDPKHKGPMHLGRISRINHYKPQLVLSLHMTWAGRGHKGGMAAVLSPGYDTFDMLRKISLGQKARSLFFASLWEPHWLVSRKGWSRFQSAYSDAWVYFHGHNTRKDSLRIGSREYYRGIRHNLITWRYKDPPSWAALARKNAKSYSSQHRRFRPMGPFWEREQSSNERRRREGGPLRYGGDNHYAGDELLRYIQFGVRLLDPKMRKTAQLGPLQKPYVSSYALPIYVNAITAYLEVGYINRKRDRRLLMQKQKEIALSLAVGIYSLFRGLKLHNKGNSPVIPRGKQINWQSYMQSSSGNYFTQVVR